MNNNEDRKQLLSDLNELPSLDEVLSEIETRASKFEDRPWWANTAIKQISDRAPTTLEDFSRMLRLFPDHVPALVERAKLLELDLDPGADHDWERIEYLRPDQPRALRSRLRLAEERGDWPSVFEFAERASLKFPDQQWWRNPYGEALERTDKTKAIAFYGAQIKRPRYRENGFEGLIRVYIALEEWQTVISLCDRCKDLCSTRRWWSLANDLAHKRLNLQAPEDSRFAAAPEDTPECFVKRSGSGAAKEASIYEFLSGLGLRIPRCLNDPGEHEQINELVLEFVDGVDTRFIRSEYGEEEIYSAFFQIGEFSQQLHTVDIGGGFGTLKTMHALPSQESSEFLRGLIRTTMKRLDRTGDHSLLSLFRSNVSELFHALRYDGPARLCHGDLHPGNALFRIEDGSPVLISVFDFEAALCADPMLDLGHTLAYLHQAQIPAYCNAVISGYGLQQDSDAHRRATIHKALYLLALYSGTVELGNKQRASRLRPEVELVLKGAIADLHG